MLKKLILLQLFLTGMESLTFYRTGPSSWLKWPQTSAFLMTIFYFLLSQKFPTLTRARMPSFGSRCPAKTPGSSTSTATMGSSPRPRPSRSRSAMTSPSKFRTRVSSISRTKPGWQSTSRRSWWCPGMFWNDLVTVPKWLLLTNRLHLYLRQLHKRRLLTVWLHLLAILKRTLVREGRIWQL